LNLKSTRNELFLFKSPESGLEGLFIYFSINWHITVQQHGQLPHQLLSSASDKYL